VPHGNSRIRSFRISPVWAKSLVAIVPTVLVLGFFMVDSSLNGILSGTLPQVSTNDDVTIRGRFETISGALEELRGMLVRNMEFEKKARVLVDLEPIEEDVRLMGAGGPEPSVAETFAGADPILDRDVRETEKELDEIIRQTRLQTESLAQVVTKLEERRDLRNHFPSICPVPGGFLSSSFGARIDPFTGSRTSHEGIDICAPKGTPVLATADGIVKFANRHAGYGLTLVIDHGHGVTTWYAHVGSIKVVSGESVKKNQIVATVGTSGRVTAPHVHYEVRDNLKPVDPAQYILPANASGN